MNRNVVCPVCTKPNTRLFAKINPLPIACNVLWPTAEAAQAAPRGPLQLTFCPDCGHIFNQVFDSSLMGYSQTYENSLHHSPHFQSYATGLVKDLVGRYDIRHKRIVEIGAGQGDFLQMMCVAGDNQGVGFDPSYIPKNDLPDYLSFVPDFYSERYADYPADVILCRHVLEHIPEAQHFIAMVRRNIGSRHETVAFFEVPNALWTIQKLGVWDLIYEHCSYFTPSSLSFLFSQNSFEIRRINTVFGGQFLTLEAMPAAGPSPIEEPRSAELEQLAAGVDRFAAVFADRVQMWRDRLEEMNRKERRVVIWGAGSKGVTFLNMVDPDRTIACAVDINPRKKGMFVSGTGQKIVDPDDLKVRRPDTVIIMNPNYRAEIQRMLHNRGVSAEILTA